MASPASIKKHPIHPMLVALPIGFCAGLRRSACGWGAQQVGGPSQCIASRLALSVRFWLPFRA